MEKPHPWLFMLLLLLALPAFATPSPTRSTALIEREACSAGVPIEYAMAIARVGSGLNPSWTGRNGSIGLMAVLPGLAAPVLEGDTTWLDHPPTNVRVSMQIIAELLETHGDWETVLTIYYRGRAGSTRASRRWVNDVFREVDRQSQPIYRPAPLRPGNLDDFGPRRGWESSFRTGDAPMTVVRCR